MNTVIYGVYIRFWPTLQMRQEPREKAARLKGTQIKVRQELRGKQRHGHE
jgi:uncharacterized membrane protein